jgi:glycosyltransferase involved in cell wall biosynthesis
MIQRKVLVELEKLHNTNSGLGQFCLCLGQALANENKNIDLHFLVPESKKGIFGKKVNYTLLKSYFSFLWNKPKVYNVWHCTHQESKYLPSQGKLILTIHDLNFLYKYTGLKKQWKLNAMQQKVNKANAIVAISEFTANEIKQHLKVDIHKLHVIYNGASLKNDEPAELPTFLKHQKYLFSIGIINPKKNFHVLLPLLQNKPDLKLVIAGNDSHVYVQKIKEKAIELGVLGQLHFLGAVSEELKFTLYKNCYAFVFPSLAEGFGLPVVEAMLLGKPVFLSALTCLPEIGGSEAFYWENFEAKYLYEVFDKGMQIYEYDNEKSSRIIAHASQYTWEKAAKAYLNLYETL